MKILVPAGIVILLVLLFSLICAPMVYRDYSFDTDFISDGDNFILKLSTVCTTTNGTVFNHIVEMNDIHSRGLYAGTHSNNRSSSEICFIVSSTGKGIEYSVSLDVPTATRIYPANGKMYGLYSKIDEKGELNRGVLVIEEEGVADAGVTYDAFRRFISKGSPVYLGYKEYLGSIGWKKENVVLPRKQGEEYKFTVEGQSRKTLVELKCLEYLHKDGLDNGFWVSLNNGENSVNIVIENTGEWKIMKNQEVVSSGILP